MTRIGRKKGKKGKSSFKSRLLSEFSKKVKRKMDTKEVEKEGYEGVEGILEESEDEPRSVPFYETGGEILEPYQMGMGSRDVENVGDLGGRRDRGYRDDHQGARGPKGDLEIRNEEYGEWKGEEGGYGKRPDYEDFGVRENHEKYYHRDEHPDLRNAEHDQRGSYGNYANGPNFQNNQPQLNFDQQILENLNQGPRGSNYKHQIETRSRDSGEIIELTKNNILKSRAIGNSRNYNQNIQKPRRSTERNTSGPNSNYNNDPALYSNQENARSSNRKNGQPMSYRGYLETNQEHEFSAPIPRQRSPSKYILDEKKPKILEDILIQERLLVPEQADSYQIKETKIEDGKRHMFPVEAIERRKSSNLDDYETEKAKSPGKKKYGNHTERSDPRARAKSNINLKLFQEYQKRESQSKFENLLNIKSQKMSAQRANKSLRSVSRSPPPVLHNNYKPNPKVYNLDLKSDVFGTIQQKITSNNGDNQNEILVDSQKITNRLGSNNYMVTSPKSINVVHDMMNLGEGGLLIGKNYLEAKASRQSSSKRRLNLLKQISSPKNYSLDNPKIQSSVSHQSKHNSVNNQNYNDRQNLGNFNESRNHLGNKGASREVGSLDVQNSENVEQIKIMNRILSPGNESIKIEDHEKPEEEYTNLGTVEIMEDMIIQNLVIIETPKPSAVKEIIKEKEQNQRSRPNIIKSNSGSKILEKKSLKDFEPRKTNTNPRDESLETKSKEKIKKSVEKSKDNSFEKLINLVNYQSEEREMEQEIDTILQQQSYLHLQEHSDVQSKSSSASKSQIIDQEPEDILSETKSRSVDDSLYKFENYSVKSEENSNKDEIDEDEIEETNELQSKKSEESENENHIVDQDYRNEDFEYHTNLEELQTLTTNIIPKSSDKTSSVKSESVKSIDSIKSLSQNNSRNSIEGSSINHEETPENHRNGRFKEFNNDFGDTGSILEINPLSNTDLHLKDSEMEPEPPQSLIPEKEELSIYISRQVEELRQPAEQLETNSDKFEIDTKNIIERKNFKVDIQILENENLENNTNENEQEVDQSKDRILENEKSSFEKPKTIQSKPKKPKKRKLSMKTETLTTPSNRIQFDTQELDIPLENEDEIIQKAREIILQNLDNREFMKQIFKEIKKNKQSQNVAGIRIIDHNQDQEDSKTKSHEVIEGNSDVSDVSIITLDSNSEEEQFLVEQRTVTAKTYMGSNFMWNDNGLDLSEQSTNYMEPSRNLQVRKHLDTMETCHENKREGQTRGKDLSGVFSKGVENKDRAQVIEDDIAPEGFGNFHYLVIENISNNHKFSIHITYIRIENTLVVCILRYFNSLVVKEHNFRNLEDVLQMEKNLIKLKKRFSITKERNPSAFKKQKKKVPSQQILKSFLVPILNILDRRVHLSKTWFWDRFQNLKRSRGSFGRSGKKPRIKKRSLKKNKNGKYEILNSSRRKSLSKWVFKRDILIEIPIC